MQGLHAAAAVADDLLVRQRQRQLQENAMSKKKRGVFVAGYWLDERLLIRVDVEGQVVADFEIVPDLKDDTFALNAFSALDAIVGPVEPAPNTEGMFFFMSTYARESYFSQLARELQQTLRTKKRAKPLKARR
jgi:hypothetical protein